MDHAIRAMTDEGSFRVIVLSAPDMVQAACKAQSVSGEVADLFSRLLLGAVLIRQTMSPGHRVQIAIHVDQDPIIRVDSFPNETTRGLVNLPPEQSVVPSGKKVLLEVTRNLHNGKMHQSFVEIAHAKNVSQGLMTYMQDSEQIFSTVAVDSWRTPEGDVQACGYILQILPDPDEGALMVMTERLSDFQDLPGMVKWGGMDIEVLLKEILYGLPFAVLETPHVTFGCPCSEARVVGALATLGRQEIEQIVRDNEVIEIQCEYCSQDYRVGPEQLKTLLTKN
jgi:molecular chaperone Hsp33